MSPTPAERERLAAQGKLTQRQVDAISKRLDAMDTRSKEGPWTRRTLELISQQPGVVSTVLARQMRRERLSFKGDVRKLRDLGLTYSLEVGYSLSPRGRAYLRSLAE
jgi:IS30 family transposase